MRKSKIKSCVNLAGCFFEWVILKGKRRHTGGASREKWKYLRKMVRITGPRTAYKEKIFEREEVMERRMIQVVFAFWLFLMDFCEITRMSSILLLKFTVSKWTLTTVQILRKKITINTGSHGLWLMFHHSNKIFYWEKMSIIRQSLRTSFRDITYIVFIDNFFEKVTKWKKCHFQSLHVSGSGKDVLQTRLGGEKRRNSNMY